MPVTDSTVDIAKGLSMPFLPVRPRQGDPVRTGEQIKSVVANLDNDKLLVRPALSGKRLCLALVDRKIFIQDEKGKWVAAPPTNGHDFLKLPKDTCLDGYLIRGAFYPFECLAVGGQSLIFRAASERETVAFQLTKLIHHTWLFKVPSPALIRATRKNLPDMEGLTFKDYMGAYTLLSKGEASKDWLRRPW